MIEVKAPEKYNVNNPIIFLAGSIEQGKAEMWQNKVVEHLKLYENLTVLNPRRDDWDSTWDQTPLPGSKFFEQVNWELQGQEDSDIICFYFAANTLSPITLLELGIFGFRNDKKVMVYVDDLYTRRGNVILTCDIYGIQWTNSFEDFLTDIDIAIEE